MDYSGLDRSFTHDDQLMTHKTSDRSDQPSRHYQHHQEAVQRPDIGIQPEFGQRKRPKTYRYDSSLAPELCWDENAERDLAEWLLTLIAEAAERGEAVVFAEPRIWQGSGWYLTLLAGLEPPLWWPNNGGAAGLPVIPRGYHWP